MRIFSSSRERARKNNERIIQRLAQAVQARKAVFRDNAVSKLTFLHPDMKFAIAMTSDKFAGYSHADRVFILGAFFDQYLPDPSRLKAYVEESNFEARVAAFSRDIETLTFESDLSDAIAKRMHEQDVKKFIRGNADKGYTYHDRFYPYDIRIRKNGRVVGRSSTQTLKPIGYFAEKVYEHVVEDTLGKGVSDLSIELLLWNYGDLIEREIPFIYIDTPRKSVSQMRDHYIRTCSQFLPFLQAAECFLHDPAWREATSDMSFIKTDRELGLI